MGFGRRHWIWQMGLLYIIDLDTAIPKWANINGDVNYFTGTAAALVEVWDWIGSLGLSQEPSLWLHSRAEPLLKQLEQYEHGAHSNHHIRNVCNDLRERMSKSVPFVDLLGPREFLPLSLFIAN